MKKILIIFMFLANYVNASEKNITKQNILESKMIY